MSSLVAFFSACRRFRAVPRVHCGETLRFRGTEPFPRLKMRCSWMPGLAGRPSVVASRVPALWLLVILQLTMPVTRGPGFLIKTLVVWRSLQRSGECGEVKSRCNDCGGCLSARRNNWWGEIFRSPPTPSSSGPFRDQCIITMSAMDMILAEHRTSTEFQVPERDDYQDARK